MTVVMYSKLLGEFSDTGDTYTALAGGAGASPYTPDMDGKLVELRVIAGRDAATSVIDHVQFKLTCTTFKPNSIEVGGSGAGLQTAPALQPASEVWQCDQPVRAGVPITIEGRNIGAETQVTPSVLLYGTFVG